MCLFDYELVLHLECETLLSLLGRGSKLVQSHLEGKYLQELIEGCFSRTCKFSLVGSAIDSDIKAAEGAESRPSSTI